MIHSHHPRLRYLIFYVTSRCNLRCAHCFYLDELNKHSEMTLEEIEHVARSLKPLTFLRITGGEPMLRKDLPDVIHAFYHHARTRRMGVITNGMRPEWVERAIPRIFELSPRLQLDIGVSIDGLQETHDEIRGVKGSFTRARGTVDVLLQFKRTHPGLKTSLVVTVSARNEPQLETLYDEIASWGVDRLSVNHIRGKVHDPSLKEVSYARYRSFAERCEQYHLQNDRSWRANLQRAKNRMTRTAIEEVVSGTPSPVSCLAGSSIGVLYSDGEVNVCEMLEGELLATKSTEATYPNLGNIRDVDFDFYRVWHTPKARQCREWISATRCSCTHECFLTASILFGKKNYPRLAVNLLQVSVGK